MNSQKGTIMTICSSTSRGAGKSMIKEGLLVAGHGLMGDAHGGPGRRQISLLAWEDVLAANNEHHINAGSGDFAENIMTKGIDFKTITMGAKLRMGGAVIRITERGKHEHTPDDYSFKGIALLAKEGLFAEVIEGSYIFDGDMITIINIANGVK
ncbi:MAG: MOSC domain-containing protein [bacterium]